MADPGSLSASFAQITTTSGLGSYTLGKTIRDKLPLSVGYTSGSIITYHVTDTSGQLEVVTGTFTSDTLTRDILVLSSTGNFIDWPQTGQRIVTPIPLPVNMGATTSWDGADLVWQSGTKDWRPDRRVRGPDGAGPGSDVILHAGSGIGNGRAGSVLLKPGNSPGAAEVAVIQIHAGGGVHPPTSIGGFPPSGIYYLYVDPSDNRLKVLGSSGTVTTLAIP